MKTAMSRFLFNGRFYDCLTLRRAHFSLLSKLLVVEREATKLILINTADDVIWNWRQHWLFLCELRVEIDGLFWASLKWFRMKKNVRKKFNFD